jgi:hypothetical protein
MKKLLLNIISEFDTFYARNKSVILYVDDKNSILIRKFTAKIIELENHDFTSKDTSLEKTSSPFKTKYFTPNIEKINLPLYAEDFTTNIAEKIYLPLSVDYFNTKITDLKEINVPLDPTYKRNLPDINNEYFNPKDFLLKDKINLPLKPKFFTRNILS